jgi:hypothetical protein
MMVSLILKLKVLVEVDVLVVPIMPLFTMWAYQLIFPLMVAVAVVAVMQDLASLSHQELHTIYM